MKKKSIPKKKIVSREPNVLDLPVIIEKGDQGGYVGRVPSIQGCYTQADTLAELRERLQEVVKLCYDTARDLGEMPAHKKITLEMMKFSV